MRTREASRATCEPFNQQQELAILICFLQFYQEACQTATALRLFTTFENEELQLKVTISGIDAWRERVWSSMCDEGGGIQV